MYPIYIEHPSTLSLNDYLRLQALLAEEKVQREEYFLQEYKKQQEQRRLQRAIYKLQVMTELYRQRQQEEAAIRAYYATKQRQYLEQQRHEFILKRHRLQQCKRQQEALKRQQEEERAIFREQERRMALAQQKVAQQVYPPVDEDPESDSEAEQEEEAHHQDQLAALVKIIFGAPSSQYQEDPSCKTAAVTAVADERGESFKHQDKQTMTLDEFVDFISKKAQALDGYETVEQEEPAAAAAAAADNDDQEEVNAMEEEQEQDTAVPSAIQRLDDNEAQDDTIDEENFEHVPSLVKSPIPTTTGIQDLVHDILNQEAEEEEDSQLFSDEDPVKLAKYDALSRIEQELSKIQEQHEDHILHVTLDFSSSQQQQQQIQQRSVSPTPTDITATTAENREFLGYEDQIMQILLRLDMIEADRDEGIRNERKSLVKRAEEMLEKLDEYKQKEWERVSCSSQRGDEDI